MKTSLTTLFILLITLCPKCLHGQQKQVKCIVNDSGEEVCSTVIENGETDQSSFGGNVPNLCDDKHDSCVHWASIGECENNPQYMLTNCLKACVKCPEERLEEIFYLRNASAQYGEEQLITRDRQDEVLFLIQKSIDYMKNYIHAENPSHELSIEITNACLNKHNFCSFWAVSGDCEGNAGFMLRECAPACLACHMIDYETR